MIARARRIAHVLAVALLAISAFLTVVVLGIAVADVAKRKLEGGSISGSFELVTVLLVFVAYGGLMAAEATRTHIRTSLVTNLLRPAVAGWARVIGRVVVIAFLSWFVFVTARDGIDSLEKSEYLLGLVHVAVWPAKLFIPVALAALLLQVVVEFKRPSASRHVSDADPAAEANVL